MGADTSCQPDSISPINHARDLFIGQLLCNKGKLGDTLRYDRKHDPFVRAGSVPIGQPFDVTGQEDLVSQVQSKYEALNPAVFVFGHGGYPIPAR
jgi:hypothetical protein